MEGTTLDRLPFTKQRWGEGESLKNKQLCKNKERGVERSQAGMQVWATNQDTNVWAEDLKSSSSYLFAKVVGRPREGDSDYHASASVISVWKINWTQPKRRGGVTPVQAPSTEGWGQVVQRREKGCHVSRHLGAAVREGGLSLAGEHTQGEEGRVKMTEALSLGEWQRQLIETQKSGR